jgi:hypothetical protein
MQNNFKFYSKSKDGLTNISASQASDLISKFNIYIQINCFTLPSIAVDSDIKQLDNLISFDAQYKKAKSANFPEPSVIQFFTDYKYNQDIALRNIQISAEILKQKNQTVTASKLKNQSKQSKELCDLYMSSQIKYQTGSLFA